MQMPAEILRFFQFHGNWWQYREAVNVKPVVEFEPQKIVRMYTDFALVDELMAQLKEQNDWLAEKQFSIDRFYEVTTKNGKYKNVILNMDLNLQKLFIEKGEIILGISQCGCFETIRMLQCFKCLRYGHFARECVLTAFSRKCFESHETRTCTIVHLQPSLQDVLIVSRLKKRAPNIA